jgi:hypothetical protein
MLLKRGTGEYDSDESKKFIYKSGDMPLHASVLPPIYRCILFPSCSTSPNKLASDDCTNYQDQAWVRDCYKRIQIHANLEGNKEKACWRGLIYV